MNPTDLAGNAQSYVQQGQNLFQHADNLSQGDMAGLATAASGLIADLPSGQIQGALSELASAGEGALAGAAIGSIIPGWGTAIGAVVGAIVGFVEGIVSNPVVVEGDPRSTAEQYTFPATANGAPYSVIPYNVLNPRTLSGNIGPGLPFYQTTAPSLYTTWSFLYNFGTTWLRPPQVHGAMKTSLTSQQAAWALCQWHMGVDVVSKMYALGSNLPNQALVQQRLQAVQQARITVGTLLGGDDFAIKAFNRLTELYGLSFSTKTPPFPAGSPSVVLWQSQSATLQFLWNMNKFLPSSQVLAAVKYGNAAPLDWTYYMRGARYDYDSGQFMRDTPTNWNTAFWFANTWRLAMAECAILEYPDTSVLHFLLGAMWLEKRGNLLDAVKWGKPLFQHDPNLSRLVGMCSHRLRAKNTKRKGKVSNITRHTGSLTKTHRVGYTSPTSKTSSVPLVAKVAIGGGSIFLLLKLLHLIPGNTENEQ